MIAAHKNVRVLLSLLKQYDVRHIVISPGSRNIPIVKSVESDPFFTCYSVVDERSAAYFAIGLYLELRVPIALSCTSGQAARNYLPGMTEAFYRKCPIVAITADYDQNPIGQLAMQTAHQMSIPCDSAKVSVDIPIIKDNNDGHLVVRRINEALDALTRYGGGPVHINIRIGPHWVRGDDTLEYHRKITRYLPNDDWPSIGNKKVLMVIGQHHPFSKSELSAINSFVEKHDVAVYVNHISNYHGKKRIQGEKHLDVDGFEGLQPDLLITIGGHLGDYGIFVALTANWTRQWRVSEDGEYSDTYNYVTKIFECSESTFFTRMAQQEPGHFGDGYYQLWKEKVSQHPVASNLPLSNALVTQELSTFIPRKSNLHLGIINTLKHWEYVSLDPSIKCYSNVASFGIDGSLSTFLGQSVASEQLNFLVIGDLSFYYDLSSIGIRHLKDNVRIIIINNRGGGEFRTLATSMPGLRGVVEDHTAASGHFGQSAEGWVTNNGLRYIGVRSKGELNKAMQELVQPSDRSIVVEVFVDKEEDVQGLHHLQHG